MHVCLCNRLTTSDIKEAIQAGANEPIQTMHHFNCMPKCCGCLNDIATIIKNEEVSDDTQ